MRKMRFLTFFSSRIDDRWCNCHLRVIVDLDINCLICQRCNLELWAASTKKRWMVKTHLSCPSGEPLLQWVWSLIGERGDEKDQGQSNLLLTHISPFFAVNHISHLECFQVFLCFVITCSYIVLDKKVKNQRISDHIRAEGIIFSTSKFETSRGTWCILYHTLYFILSHLYSTAQLFHNTIINHCHGPFSHATHVLLSPKAFQLYLTHWTCLSASCIVFLLCIPDYESNFQ